MSNQSSIVARRLRSVAMSARRIMVTGGNRGIGAGLVAALATRGDTAVLAARSLERGLAAARAMQHEHGIDPLVVALDVTDDASVAAAVATVEDELGGLDGLINNAGVIDASGVRPSTADITDVVRIMDTNAIGAWRVLAACTPLLRAAGRAGRVVNVSSGLGALTDMGSGTPAYNVSKAAMNAVTRIFAAELAGHGVKVNSVCPDWVASDMGGGGGRPIAEGVASVLWALDLPDDGPTGGFFRDGGAIDW